MSKNSNIRQRATRQYPPTKIIVNKDTIREARNVLMTNGLKIEYGNEIGKIIIFAKNHGHAEKILGVFGQEYPNYAR